MTWMFGMSQKIVDDRLLARLAYEAVGRTDASDPENGMAIAVGQVAVALHAMGVIAGPEIVRTVQADVARIFSAGPEMARALAIAAQADRRGQFIPDLTPRRLAAVG